MADDHTDEEPAHPDETGPVGSGAVDSDDVDSGDVDSGDVDSVDVGSGEGDVLPDDLQPALADYDDYVFPNNNRRRVPGYLYLAMAVVCVLVAVVWGSSDFVNAGWLGAAALLAAFGAYSLVSGWDLNIDEREALVRSVAAVGFPVGHASAQMGWRGWLSKPTWRILLYSAEEPPAKRGFVLVDGVNGDVVDAFVEDNPEDWSELTSSGASS